MSDIFISYARSTEARARQVAEALADLGYDVWRDDALPAHQAYAEVIQERLDAAKAVLVLWSADAVKSQWVRSEANRAREEGKLVQARLDACAPPMPFDQIQCADLNGWTGGDAPGWRKVVASLATLMEVEHGRPPPASSPSPRVQPPTKSAVRHGPIIGAVALALILVAAFCAWALLHETTNSGRSLRSVAVLPIHNLTGDIGADAVADRIT
jgi:hypothetical protein